MFIKNSYLTMAVLTAAATLVKGYDFCPSLNYECHQDTPEGWPECGDSPNCYVYWNKEMNCCLDPNANVRRNLATKEEAKERTNAEEFAGLAFQANLDQCGDEEYTLELIVAKHLLFYAKPIATSQAAGAGTAGAGAPNKYCQPFAFHSNYGPLTTGSATKQILVPENEAIAVEEQKSNNMVDSFEMGTFLLSEIAAAYDEAEAGAGADRGAYRWR